uniref:Rho-GAP domain-containing protein n=1 Tax=Macrostomum lignano TaxID=282301 RepID=A0A1I8F6M3_9PLAT
LRIATELTLRDHAIALPPTARPEPATPGRERESAVCPVEKPGGSVSLAAARQLRGFQILVQLLPHSNRWMLSSLLKTARQVAELPRTLMTPENLGTVFGPLLLCPRQMKSTDDYARIIALSNRAVTYMIRHAGPEHLVIDAMRSLSTERSRCYSRSRSCSAKPTKSLTPDADSDDDNDEAVDVCMNFVDRSTASRLGGRDYTQLQVAQLYAAVQAMPESAKKSALVRKFSAAANSVVVDPTTGLIRQMVQLSSHVTCPASSLTCQAGSQIRVVDSSVAASLTGCSGHHDNNETLQRQAALAQSRCRVSKAK